MLFRHKIYVTTELHQRPTLDVVRPIHRHRVDLVTRLDTDQMAVVFHRQQTVPSQLLYTAR